MNTMGSMDTQSNENFQAEALNETTVQSGKKYLIFITDDLRFGVNAEYVVEILNNHVITPLPMTPDYVCGIFNMRGQIIPILDIRLKLGKPPIENPLMVVIRFDGAQAGILVDSVDQMIEISDDLLLPMPSKHPQRLVSGMCTLPDGSGTMLILDCEQLLDHE